MQSCLFSLISNIYLFGLCEEKWARSDTASAECLQYHKVTTIIPCKQSMEEDFKSSPPYSWRGYVYLERICCKCRTCVRTVYTGQMLIACLYDVSFLCIIVYKTVAENPFRRGKTKGVFFKSTFCFSRKKQVKPLFFCPKTTNL